MSKSQIKKTKKKKKFNQPQNSISLVLEWEELPPLDYDPDEIPPWILASDKQTIINFHHNTILAAK